MKRVSIRFFNEREVRAVWDDAAAKWWFSVLDVVGAINGESDYSKTRNYWKYLKTKLKREENQLVSGTTQLKHAMVESVTRSTEIERLVSGALTDKIADRETFMKGIDYSYYHEEED